MDYSEIRKHKDLEILREGAHSNWREELQEDHPFVDVMPSSNQKQKDAEKKMKEMKKAKKMEKDEMKEEIARKTDGSTMQDGPRPTGTQRRGALQHQQREINRLENTEDERELTASERARLNLYKAKKKVWSKDAQETGE